MAVGTPPDALVLFHALGGRPSVRQSSLTCGSPPIVAIFSAAHESAIGATLNNSCSAVILAES
jgi:hypothetical protein